MNTPAGQHANHWNPRSWLGFSQADLQPGYNDELAQARRRFLWALPFALLVPLMALAFAVAKRGSPKSDGNVSRAPIMGMEAPAPVGWVRFPRDPVIPVDDPSDPTAPLLRLTPATQEEWHRFMGTPAPCEGSPAVERQLSLAETPSGDAPPTATPPCAPHLPLRGLNFWETLALLNAASRRADRLNCYEMRRCEGWPGIRDPRPFRCRAVTLRPYCDGFRLPTALEWHLLAPQAAPSTDGETWPGTWLEPTGRQVYRQLCDHRRFPWSSGETRDVRVPWETVDDTLIWWLLTR